ncbi:hypothetical protein COE55_18485 [Priestia megaterium]|uniref:hypothetical protein n=1 Tax=Priestia megaterium TaxID=1404 RepID=UPI000BFE3C34|nr:hypothetical protein [Priestia megaterium]PGZ76947.1 hypothetical protein COE55_18485 [Priestia megaterium]
MDTIEQISLSRIATIISNHTIFKTPNNSKWERILSNAGQSQLFNEYSYGLTPDTFREYQGREFTNPNPRFSEFYSVLKAILKEVYKNGTNAEAFAQLMGSIVEEMDINYILNDDLQDTLDRKTRYNNPLEYIFGAKDNDECLDIIQKEAKNEYHELVNNLHILNLDIGYSNYKLVLKAFTDQGAIELNRNPSLLMDWLERKHSAVAASYKEALENYIKGYPISCISTCRNIIVGIFDESKEDETKWLKGLQRLSTDTYIEKVDNPRQIVQGSANKQLGLTNVKFNFSRFQTIYQLYSLSSDLGPHINEGPMIENIQYRENATMSDALWILRMTEDLLIWIKETQREKDNQITADDLVF